MENVKYVNGLFIRWVKFDVHGGKSVEAYILTPPWYTLQQTLLRGKVIWSRSE